VCRMKVVPVSRKVCGFEKARFDKGIRNWWVVFVFDCLEVSVGIVDVDKGVIIEQPGPGKKE
jgi:hypothetical protein